MGEFLGAVARHALGQGSDARLVAPFASTGANEAVGSDGGFLVQTDFSTTLLRRAYNNTSVLNGGSGYSGVSRIPISPNANQIKINALAETSRADGSRWGGIQAYWLEEGGTYTSSRPKFRQVTLSLKKLIGLCYATDELLADAMALEAVLSDGFSEEFSFKIQDALFNGTGAGQPLGILNAACLVSVAKESAQTADTINATNIQKMYARMWARGVPNSVWHINQDCWPQLFKLADAGNNSLYMPPGGMSAAPYGTLMGRPVVPVEQCQTVGDKGDIYFCDWSEYVWCDKGSLESASSMHVQFLTGEMVYRFTFRCDGQPKWNAALTPFKGSNTQGPFITLAERA
jgi:HK97 family phage major capsid protein